MRKIVPEQIAKIFSGMDDATKIYIGADSVRFLTDGKHFAEYVLVVVVHINGNSGCFLFGEKHIEPEYTPANKSNMRLLMEAYKVADLYLKIRGVCPDREIEVHLDLSPNALHKSNDVIQQAIGYIRGTCQVEPKVKPFAFAASNAADRLQSR